MLSKYATSSCDQAILMEAGHVIADTSPKDVIDAYKDRWNRNMRLQRRVRKSPTKLPGSASESDQLVDPIAQQTVDSRAYAFAYAIRERSQLPADFPVDEDFERALFLPQELVPRFEQPRYVPRLLLLNSEDLIVYSHPKCAPWKTRIPFIQISHIEVERFLTSCSLIIFTPGRVVHLPFHGRDQKYLATFVQELKHRWCPGDCLRKTIFRPQAFGRACDYKFEQIEKLLDISPAAVVARFFVPPKQLVKSHLFWDEFSWSSGAEIVLTASELHYFSDDKDGYRQLYGFSASWAPLQNVIGIRWDEMQQSLIVQLLGDLSLKLPVREELRGEAKKFVEFCSRCLLAGSRA